MTGDMFHQGVGKLVEYDPISTGPGVPDWRRGDITVEHLLLYFGWRRALSRTGLGRGNGKIVCAQS